MQKARKNNRGLRLLLEFWSRFGEPDNAHCDWLLRHARVLPVKRGQILQLAGERQRAVYFVCEGLLARVGHTVQGEVLKRNIYSIALPGFALTSTSHLFSRTLHNGDMVALRSGTIVMISYAALIEARKTDALIGTLINVLIHKKKRQLEIYLEVIHSTSPFQRYLLFAKHMPDIKAILSQQEQADFLGISRRTVQEASYFLLTGKRPQK